MLEFALISTSRTKKVPNSCVDTEIVLLVPRHWMCCGLFTYSHTILWYRTLRYESSTGTRSVVLYQRRPGSKNFKFFCFVRHMEYIYIYLWYRTFTKWLDGVPHVDGTVLESMFDFIYESREYSFVK